MMDKAMEARLRARLKMARDVIDNEMAATTAESDALDALCEVLELLVDKATKLVRH